MILNDNYAEPRGRTGRVFRAPRRFEFKYVIDPLLAPELRRVVQLFTVPDPYALAMPERRYPICSLYLDTEDLRLYRQSQTGERARFKLRLRSYSDDAESPVLLEIKRRVDRIVHKRRVALPRELFTRFAHAGTNGWARDLAAPVLRELETFADHTRLAAARPVAKVRYLREAYESAAERVRITFDTDVAYTPCFDWDLRHAGSGWQPTPIEGVVFEVKFSEVFPSWVQGIIRDYGLEARSVPKYGLSVDDFLARDRGTPALHGAGFRLPPRFE